MFDPVLEKQFIKRGGKYLVNVSDKMMEYNMAFTMYFISRLPNPSFSPELQAKTCVVDFTVTQLGLEEQLLGKVRSQTFLKAPTLTHTSAALTHPPSPSS